MNLANLLISAAVSLCGTGVGVALLQGVFSRDGRRADAAKGAAEAQARQHETWFEEAKDAYARVDKECRECKDELRQADERHDKAIGKIRVEVAELREALIKSLNTVDELLPYAQGLPEEKMREIQARNRAVRRAVWVQP